MQSFFERLKLNTVSEPDLTVLRSENFPDGITYGQLDEMSGRVCGYLMERGIGRGDFVTVLLPREVSAYISVIGIWKSGAAMTLLEKGYSAERVRYIEKDLNSRLEITEEVFEDMMRHSVCTEYEMPAVHDACYATYTSGSTGNPKGILHEFGKLDTFDFDYHGEMEEIRDNRNFAVITPLQFGPSLRDAITSLMHGKCIYVVPKKTVENPALLLKYFNENRISETSATVSLTRTHCFASQYMKNVIVHSEPCDGVYCEGPRLINMYTLSEVVFPIASFLIDKRYEKTPVGRINNAFDVKIIDKDGRTLGANQTGELIVEDPFTRGYINLPEKTAAVFRNGYFHTGDLAYFDDNGLYYLCGRKDDMIKINGNRIEPAEIESAVKKSLGTDNAVSRCFSDESRSFIAVYLLKSELSEKGLLNSDTLVYSSAEMRRKLADILPDYMIPSYYVVMDTFPRNENDKLSRKELPLPEIKHCYTENDRPKNEKEMFFCRLFSSVLNLPEVGVNDDFYELGGDSLATVRAISQCRDFELTAEELFTHRTARMLAEKIQMPTGDDDAEAQNSAALLNPCCLLPEQKVTFEVQLEYPDYTANNLTRFFRLSQGTDINRFRTAVDRILKAHPVFSSVLKKTDGEVKMYYCPDLFRETQSEKIGTDELDNIITEQRKSFCMENSLLYRRKILICNGALYFYFEIHHIITDGISLNRLFEEICNAYCDEDFLPPTDFFYLVALRNNNKKTGKLRTKAQIIEDYNMAPFQDTDINCIRPDEPVSIEKPAKYERKLLIDKKRVTKSEVYKKYNGNVLFMTCFLKAVAEYNNNDRAFTFWVYNGRDGAIKENAHGMLIRTLPMGCVFENADSRISLDYVRNSVVRCLSGADSDFVEATGGDEFTFCPYFIYQKDILHNDTGGLFEEELELQPSGAIFEFHLIDNSDCDFFGSVVKYYESGYHRDSIIKICEIFEKTVNNIIG